MTAARDALLAKVVAHYAEHGVGDTSLRSLAAAIGTSQRMLHYHFGSREDVLTAVIDAVAGGQAERIGRLFDEEPDRTAAGDLNWRKTVEGAEVRLAWQEEAFAGSGFQVFGLVIR